MVFVRCQFDEVGRYGGDIDIFGYVYEDVGNEELSMDCGCRVQDIRDENDYGGDQNFVFVVLFVDDVVDEEVGDNFI